MGGWASGGWTATHGGTAGARVAHSPSTGYPRIAPANPDDPCAQVDGDRMVVKTLKRAALWEVQTPQARAQQPAESPPSVEPPLLACCRAGTAGGVCPPTV